MFLPVLRKRHFFRRCCRFHRRSFRGIRTQRQYTLSHKENVAVLLSVECEVLVAESDVVIPLQMLSHLLGIINRRDSLVEGDALLLGQSDTDLNSRELDNENETVKSNPVGLFGNAVDRDGSFLHIIRLTNSVGKAMRVVLDETGTRTRHIENKINIS